MNKVRNFKVLLSVTLGVIFLMFMPVSAISAESSSSSQLSGPDGVERQIEKSYGDTPATFELDALERAIKPYFDWKKRMKEDHGFTIGFNAYWLYQKASDSLPNTKDYALGAIYRLHGSWTLVGRDTGNRGGIGYRLEYRNGVGGFKNPTELSSNIGVDSLNTGFVYSDFDLDLSIINWTQLFNNKTAGFSIGRQAYDVYLDAFPFQTISKGFINKSFVINPALAGTGIGALGAVVKGYITKNIWFGGQIYDNNAVSGNFDLDTVKEGEWLKALEVGWSPSAETRNDRRVQFTYWHNDERQLKNQASGNGWAVSAVWKMDKLFPFLRFGHSNGGGASARNAASTGFEYTTRPDQAWNLGFGWANPVAATAKDEYVIETSYKFQVFKHFSLLPDLQYVIHPANNPNEDRVWVAGLRAFLAI